MSLSPSAANEKCHSSESRLRFDHAYQSGLDYLNEDAQVRNPRHRLSHDAARKIQSSFTNDIIRHRVIQAAMSPTSLKKHCR